MRKIISFLIIVPSIIIFGVQSLSDGESCNLESGLKGICRSIRNCSYATELLQKRKRPEHCAFVGKEPIVCCPLNNLTTKLNLKAFSNFKTPECKLLTEGILSSNIPENVVSLSVTDQPHIESVTPKIQLEDVEILDGFDLPPESISKGQKVKDSEFPHMAQLGIGKSYCNIEWYCGGSLISEKFILTAAHCIHSVYGTINFAQLGSSVLDYRREIHEVVNNIVHPEYDPLKHYHDIAISEIRYKVLFNDDIRPVCVHTESAIDSEAVLIVTGWGSTEFGGEKSKDLLKTDLSLFTYDECSVKYPANTIRKLPRGLDDEIQFCAGGRKEGKDTCQGDSGGPIHITFLNGKYKMVPMLIGITSFGKVCGYVNQPGVYVRIYPYLEWVDSIVWGDGTPRNYTEPAGRLAPPLCAPPPKITTTPVPLMAEHHIENISQKTIVID